MRPKYSILILIFFLSSCADNSAEATSPPNNQTSITNTVPTESLAIPDNRFSNSYKIIIFGNSHVRGLDNLIETLIRKGNPSANIRILIAGGGFLDAPSSNDKRSDLLESEPWTHVILQGQKYSQSGVTVYPTTAAQAWIEKAKKHGITPILFPEHPQRGNDNEGRRVHLIHSSIAAKQKSCIAPIGLTWDKVIMIEPKLTLNSHDGNHASFLGRLLTAFSFYEVITGEPADLLTFIEESEVTESTQQLFKQLVSETIQSNQPCNFDI